MATRYHLEDQEARDRIKDVLLESYLSNWGEDFLQTDEGRKALEDEVYQRYHNALDFVVPWIDRHRPLRGSHLVEIGCGSGSSTAAFAHFAREVDAYEIDSGTLEGARRRLKAMGLENARFHQVTPEALWTTIRDDHGDGAEIVVLLAVLEHLLIDERIETLRAAWDLLRPGGLLVIAETPNRLTYWDHHTAQLPFFHLLPDELAFLYYDRSARFAFKNGMQHALADGHREAEVMRARWGTGVSYHEFEVAFRTDDLRPILASDGSDDEIARWFPDSLEEELLQTYVRERGIGIPVGFTRQVLNLIFRKPD